jgi:hypothetical protein
MHRQILLSSSVTIIENSFCQKPYDKKVFCPKIRIIFLVTKSSLDEIIVTGSCRKELAGTSVADPGCLFWIPDLNCFIPDPGSQIQGLNDPVSRVSASKNLRFLNPETVSKLSEKLSGMFIPDPRFQIQILFYPGSRIRIQGS